MKSFEKKDSFIKSREAALKRNLKKANLKGIQLFKNDAPQNKRSAIQELPPLIKGYLRIGAQVGDGAVIDHQFNTTDVCIIVKTDDLPARYKAHYERKFKNG